MRKPLAAFACVFFAALNFFQPLEAAAKQVEKSPVVLDGKTLFHVSERIYSFSPEDRAEAISRRIKRLSRDSFFDAGAIEAVEGERTTDIVAGDLVVMTVTEEDARAEGRLRGELAAEYAGKIRLAVELRREEYSKRGILLRALYVAATTAVFLVLIFVMRRLFSKLYKVLKSWEGTRIPPLKIQSLEILSSGRVTYILIEAAKALKLAIIVVLLYFYIPLVLSFFPWTRGISSKILGYVIEPLMTVWAAFAEYIPNLFFILVIVLVSRYFVKATKFVFDEIRRGRIIIPGFYTEWATPTYKIARFMIICFVVIIIFPYLPGSQSPAFRGVSIFFGVLFSLGSTSAVANVIAGVILTYTRAFQTGDRVRIADTIGDVIEKTLLVTRIRTIKNEFISIPNAMVLGSHIINYSSPAKDSGLILHTTVTIGYDVPWRKVNELLIAAAKATENVMEEPEPFVFQTALNDYNVSYELNAYTETPHMMAKIYSDLHMNVQEKFNEAGVEILSPGYTALRDGNPTTVPEERRPKDYVAPAFGIRLDGQKRA